jgi:flagellar basal-body rod protein FlgF
MDSAMIAALTRQSGLMREMQVVANNVANISTTGFRAEGLIFAEHVARLEGASGGGLSMAHAAGRNIRLMQGDIEPTGGDFDFAIEGEGFFLLQSPEGESLTRAGRFMPNEAGELVNPDGYLLLDAGGAPIFIPPDAENVMLARDGTLSADGRPITQLGLWQPADPGDLRHLDGVRFATEGPVEPVLQGTMIQGFLESSNADPVMQIARMIEVQRAYELGQGFLEREDERIRNFLRTAGAQV